MAKVYGPPEGFDPPELDTADVQGWFDAMDEWQDKLAEWCRAQHEYPDPLVGYVYRHPVADGKASYMVLSTRPLQLIELDDEYRLPDAHLRGLRITDLRAAKKRDEKLAELFGRAKKVC